MAKVSVKVAGQLPALSLELTAAFKEVIINYGEESVAAFTTVAKKIKNINKAALESIAGGEIAVGLVSMIAANEGSFINKLPKQVTDTLEAIVKMFDGATEELPDTSGQWLLIVSGIIIIPPENIMIQDVEVKTQDQGVATTEASDVIVDTNAASNEPIIAQEEQAALNDAVSEFVHTIGNITEEMVHEASVIVEKQKKEEKEKESSLATDILVGAAVVTGVVCVGAGLYYAYQGLFGSDKFEGVR